MKQMDLYVPAVFHPFHVPRKVLVAMSSAPVQSRTCQDSSQPKQVMHSASAFLLQALHVPSDVRVRSVLGGMI